MDKRHTDDRSISRRELFDVWLFKEDRNSKRLAMYMHVLRQFNVEHVSREVEDNLTLKIKYLESKFYQKWLESNRTKSKFVNRFSEWLDTMESFVQVENSDSSNAPTSSRGRPKKSFTELCDKSKRRLIKPVLKNIGEDEIITVAQISLYNAGNRNASALLKEMVCTTNRASNIRKAYKNSPSKIQKMSKEEALASFLDGKMSQRSYRTIEKHLKRKGCDVFPSYHAVLDAKKSCYQDIIITEISAEVKLQSLLNHTVSRLCEIKKEVLMPIKNDLNRLYCIFKWGCDGSSGYSSYKQRFSEKIALNQEDNAMFVISLVPVQFYNIAIDNKKQILWQNPCPSSTIWCRPIKILLQSESESLIKSEIAIIRQQIRELYTTKVFADLEFEVNNKLYFCMVDGKICSSVMDISSQTCYICGCTPTNMNDKHKLASFSDNPESYQFGRSPLHARIRIFECLLKICYRLEMKTWQVRGTENKQKLLEKNKIVQQEFREKTGLLVDVVKVGYGTTNDGNTARRFFENPTLSASITGLDETLIANLSVLVEVLASNYEINVERFRSYCNQEMFSQSNNARSFELFALYTSDPYINSFREKPRKSFKALSSGARALLQEPSLSDREWSTDDSDSSENTDSTATKE